MAGPLQGGNVVEFVGLGPAPFCGMLLADMGAEVQPAPAPRFSRTPAAPPVRSAPEPCDDILRRWGVSDDVIERHAASRTQFFEEQQ